MKYRNLGNTGLKVSEIGLGTWALSGSGYGPVSKDESEKVIENALDLGINFIDTADLYGNGYCESLIGNILSRRKDRDTLIATKFGWNFYSHGGVRADLSRSYINFALEKSLERLRRDRIDLYQIHVPRPDRILEEDVYQTLEDLRSQGKIRFYGISVKHARDGTESLKTGSVSAVQLPYNIINSATGEILIPLFAQKNLGIIVREPLESGLLSGKYSLNSEFDKKDHRNGWSRQFLQSQLSKIKKLKSLERPDRTLPQLSIRYILDNSSVSTVIPGCRNRAQLEENIASIHKDLEESEKRYVDTLFK